MLKVAIVGCGKIADDHASQIQRIGGCEIVAVCDKEPLMARQLYDRFRVRRHFSNLDELLNETSPDVVHVTTPPQTHYAIAMRCLEAGCHVYVEKPFALDAEETRSLLASAAEKGLKITAGHDAQFSHAARRMRSLVSSGFLGAEPVHMESYYCYPFESSAYAEALLSDKAHWVRRLPGKLLHNIISHGIARISEFLTTDSLQVFAWGFTSPLLKSMGENEIIDELRVTIAGSGRQTAYFTFSTQMRPAIHQFRVFGQRNGLLLDETQQTLIELRGKKFKSYAERFVPPVTFAKQYMGNVVRNAGMFLRRDFHMKSGMRYLIDSFYRSIAENSAVPIPHREILLTATIMDRIFSQISGEDSPLRSEGTEGPVSHNLSCKASAAKF
jgi:predicted dehydrogenase